MFCAGRYLHFAFYVVIPLTSLKGKLNKLAKGCKSWQDGACSHLRTATVYAETTGVRKQR